MLFIIFIIILFYHIHFTYILLYFKIIIIKIYTIKGRHTGAGKRRGCKHARMPKKVLWMRR